MKLLTFLLLSQLLWLRAVAGGTVCPANVTSITRSDASACKGLIKNPRACCQSLRTMETKLLSAKYKNGSADVMKIVGSPSYNGACRTAFLTVLRKKGVTADVFSLCSAYWLFPLAETNISTSTCPLTSYDDVGSVVSYRGLTASCNNAKCSSPATQTSTSLCGQSILEAAIMLTENDSQINDCYYVVTMRLAQAHFKSVYKSVFFLCDARPPLANATINVTLVYPPPPAAAPPAQAPTPSPLAQSSSLALSPAPAPSPTGLAPSSAPAPAPSSAEASSPAQAPSSAPSPAPSSLASPAPAPSPASTNDSIGVPVSLNGQQEPSGTPSTAKTKAASSSGTNPAFSGLIVVLVMLSLW